MFGFNSEKLFAEALNIQEPIIVTKVDFNKETGELHIYMDFKKGGKFKCKICGAENLSAYDTEEKVWRHLNFFQYKAYIHFRTPRTDCPEHGMHLIDVPWGTSGTGFTLLLEAFIMQLAKHLPVRVIANMLDEHDTKIWRVIKRHINNARAIEDYSEVKDVGVDETSCKKGHDYVTLFVDMEKHSVMFATEGKDSSTIIRFKEDLKYHKATPSQIENFSTDMSPAFIKGVKENFKWADITFDRFHVMKIMNEALDKVRKEESKTHIELKNTRYLWLKNQNNWTTAQANTYKGLSNSNLKTGKAYRIKLALQDIYSTASDKFTAMGQLKKWLSWAFKCRIEQIRDVAKTVKKHWNGIINYFESRLTNGVLEGINSIVQAAKARARGYRSSENFIAMIYLIAGKLTFNFT